MKTIPLLLAAGILASILVAPFASNTFAALQSQTKAPELRIPKIEYPIGENCVITVDPVASNKPLYSGQPKLTPGFIAPDTVRGVLTRVDESWIVLQEGTNENWIPRNKVLLLRVGP